MTLEFHDDIIIFDSSTTPNKVSFYQVKTNKRNWSLNSLTKRDKGKLGLLNSYLGKLYEHLEKHENSVESLNFVTNSKIVGKLNNGTKCEDTSKFCCSDLEIASLNKIVQDLKKEHTLNSLKKFESITYFKLGELSIDKHTELTKIKLADYIEKHFPDIRYQISPLYKSIFDEIKMKSNFEENITSFDELKKKKSISRTDFNYYLETLIKTKTFSNTSKDIERRLDIENADFNMVLSFKRNSKLYEVRKMTYNDKSLINLEREINRIRETKQINYSQGLINSTDEIFNYLDIEKYLNNLADEEFIKTVIFYQIYE